MIASAGDADPGQDRPAGFLGQIQHAFAPPLGGGGRIEPAEPEPPPAHSIGRVGEDTMGRAGQIVRPCWLGVLVSRWWCGAGGEELVPGLVVRLVLPSFY